MMILRGVGLGGLVDADAIKSAGNPDACAQAGGTWSDIFPGILPAACVDPSAAVPGDAATTPGPTGSWFSDLFSSAPSACVAGYVESGGNCVPIGSTAAASATPPSSWTSSVGPLIAGIAAGFAPSTTKPVMATMPVTVVVPQPWYKTPLGMGAIAIAAIGGIYYATSGSSKKSALSGHRRRKAA